MPNWWTRWRQGLGASRPEATVGPKPKKSASTRPTELTYRADTRVDHKGRAHVDLWLVRPERPKDPIWVAHWRWWACPECGVGVIRALGITDELNSHQKELVSSDITWVCSTAYRGRITWADEHARAEPEDACMHSPTVPDFGDGQLPNVVAPIMLWWLRGAGRDRE